MAEERCTTAACGAPAERTERRRRLTEIGLTMGGGLRDLGPLDPAIADLAVETSEAAVAVFDVWSRRTSRCIQAATAAGRSIDVCEAELAQHGELLAQLEALLRRWDPYL